MIQFNDIESIKHMIEFKDKFGSLATNDSSFRHHPNRKKIFKYGLNQRHAGDARPLKLEGHVMLPN